MKLKKVIINGEVVYKEVKEDTELEDEDLTIDDEDLEDDEEEEDDDDENDEDEDDEDDEDNITVNINGYTFKHHRKNNEILGMLPFLKRDDRDEIVKKILQNDEKYSDIPLEALFPFISRSLCDEIFLMMLKNKDYKHIKRIIPFVSKEVLSKLIDEYIDGKYQDFNFNIVYPFLSGEDIKKLFEYRIAKNKKS